MNTENSINDPANTATQAQRSPVTQQPHTSAQPLVNTTAQAQGASVTQQPHTSAPPPANTDAQAQRSPVTQQQQPHASNKAQNSCCSVQQVTPKIVTTPPQYWGAVKEWSNAQWHELYKLVNSGTTGEELMKFFGFKRRKDLEHVFYNLSRRTKTFVDINWQTDFESGAHSLPELKSGKDGLRISTTRFKRYGFDIQPNTLFEFKKISETEIKLIITG